MKFAYPRKKILVITDIRYKLVWSFLIIEGFRIENWCLRYCLRKMSKNAETNMSKRSDWLRCTCEQILPDLQLRLH